MTKKRKRSPDRYCYRPRLTHNKEDIAAWEKLIADVVAAGGIQLYLRENTKAPPDTYHKTQTTYDENGGQTLNVVSTQIKTVEELIAYHCIDTDTYDVHPAESTYWESGAKMPDGEIVTIPLHRLKVRIVPKKPDEVSVTAMLSEYLQSQPTYTLQSIPPITDRHGVAVIGDLHVGANVKAILNTPDYNLNKLLEYLAKCANLINQHRYTAVSVFILGDIIESFTGLNHKNTWQELQLYGMEAIKAAYKLITAWFLNLIPNLDKIYIIGGNHDRTSESMDLDVRGGAANMLAFMLQEKGYQVQFHPLLIAETIDGLHYIATHGNFNLSKFDAGQTLFKFGKQDRYNLIMQAHKHTREGSRGISKKPMQVAEFKTVELDDLNYRKITIAPMITGNFYSQSLGYNSTAGFTLIENSGTGKPIVHDYCF